MPAIFQASKTVIGAPSPAELGVLVCERPGWPPFAESRYVKRLSVIAAGLGMQLFAFAPWTWNPRDDSVKGWSWNEQSRDWEPSNRRLPSVVYDRAWPESEEEKLRYRRALKAVQTAKRLVLLNGSLPHKGKVYEMLVKESEFAAYLPPTALYEGASSLALWLRKHNGAAFLKPIAGSQGKRVLAITLDSGGGAALSGRDDRNRPLIRSYDNSAEALRRIDRWIGDRKYLMQPLLDMRSGSGEPCDLRALMQKNRRGRWSLTGIAARIGAPFVRYGQSSWRRQGRSGCRYFDCAVRRTPGRGTAGGDRQAIFVHCHAFGTNFWEIRRNRFGLRNRTERQALVSGSQLQAGPLRHELRWRRSRRGRSGAASVLCQIHLASTCDNRRAAIAAG